MVKGSFLVNEGKALLSLPLLQLCIACLLGLQMELQVVQFGPKLGCLLPHLGQRLLQVVSLALCIHKLRKEIQVFLRTALGSPHKVLILVPSSPSFALTIP